MTLDKTLKQLKALGNEKMRARQRMKPLHLLAAALLLTGCATFHDRDAVTLEGKYTYSDESGGFSMYFHDGKCSGQDQDEDLIEIPCFMRGHLVYLKAVAPEGEQPSRNVWV